MALKIGKDFAEQFPKDEKKINKTKKISSPSLNKLRNVIAEDISFEEKEESVRYLC
jgi:hypothetical protein